MRVPHNYFEHGGKRYAALRPTYPEALARSLADVSSGSGVAVDVGCGSGQLTTLLAPHFNKVIGIDPSAEQLCAAQRVGNVVYLKQSAENIDLEPSSADLIVAAQAAHWFDLDRFYEQVRRVGGPGATIALLCYGVPSLPDEADAVFKHGYWEVLHDFWPPERRDVENGYTTLPFPFEPVVFPDYMCRKRLVFEDFVGYIRTWSAFRVARELGQQNVFEDFIEQLGQAWEAGCSKDVIWPVFARVGRMPASPDTAQG